MAAIKTNNQTTKLKAGQKKKVNKWLIIGGVAAVAIIGAVVVRFSSASTWKLVAYNNVNWTLTTKEWKHGASYRANTGIVQELRGCVKAYSTDKTKNAVITISFGNLKYKTITVTPQGGKYCSNADRTDGVLGVYSNYSPAVIKYSGPNVWVTATSVEVIR